MTGIAQYDAVEGADVEILTQGVVEIGDSERFIWTIQVRPKADLG